MRYSRLFLSLIFSSFFIINTYAGGVELPETEKNPLKGCYLFTGFEFGSYVPSPIGLDAEIAESYIKIRDNELPRASNEYYSIVGHSQGGLRVMAYSTYLKKQGVNNYNRLQAVITVSGIDKGLLALDGGFGPINRKFREDVSIIYNGVKAGIGKIPFVDTVNYFVGFYPSDSEVFDKLLNFLPDNFRCYVKPALDGVNPDYAAEIRDMFPRSEFNKNFVSDSKKHDYKVRTGTDHYLDWCVVKSFTLWGQRINIWGWQWKSRPRYTWCTAWEDFPKFGAEMPYGYIVGLNSNTLSMCSKELELKIREAVKTDRKFFDDVYNFHKAAQWTVFGGICMNSWKNADRARRARNWMGNLDGELNELKGSSENDGLVAKQSQYFPKSFTDPNTGDVRLKHQNVLGQTSWGYVGMPQYNHKNIDPAENTEVQAVIQSMIKESLDRRIR